jgi:hypothetical protein
LMANRKTESQDFADDQRPTTGDEFS